MNAQAQSEIRPQKFYIPLAAFLWPRFSYVHKDPSKSSEVELSRIVGFDCSNRYIPVYKSLEALRMEHPGESHLEIELNDTGRGSRLPELSYDLNQNVRVIQEPKSADEAT